MTAQQPTSTEGDSITVEVVSPRDTTTATAAPEMVRGVEFLNDPFEPRVDPDAQTTVTDFIDFTEYFSADMVRSLALIDMLDDRYIDASIKAHELTTKWGQLPTMTGDERPSPITLRADIAEQLNQTIDSRIYAQAEAARMSDNVHRHYNKAKMLLSKLQKMMDNYPTEDRKHSAEPRSPQMARAKPATRPAGDGTQKPRQKRMPKITVPGEVLAPYDIEYDNLSDGSDISSDEESDVRRTPAPRIKLNTGGSSVRKPINRTPRTMIYTSEAMNAAVAANARALLNPPPPNAVIGSADAPWLQLTQYEMAKLRKRMKKNATWTPSETMIARELKALGRGPEAYRDAKKKAEDEGRDFEAQVPTLVVDAASGVQHLPAGAISADCIDGDSLPTSNRGMKLNEAKKLKREAMAKLAVEGGGAAAVPLSGIHRIKGESISPIDAKASGGPSTLNAGNRAQGKRKRDTDGEIALGEIQVETPNTSRQSKRTKVETPVPPPRGFNYTSPNGGSRVTQTPVPIPIPMLRSSVVSPPQSVTKTVTTTTSVPTKPPAQTPVPLPKTDQRKSITPVFPPTRESRSRDVKRDSKDETDNKLTILVTGASTAADEVRTRRSVSRGLTPRPASRGKAGSQEPPSLASDRPRRASTARITPGPEPRPQTKRPKRPAPGIVSRTSSGGNSAIGKRKAAPKKKPRAPRKDKGQTIPEEDEDDDVEVDDEGNPIDPEEARYCLCNRVSFGVMIQCENADNCKQDWFHIECVGLDNIPARTTKWYCPDCRVLLNIGEKGEVSARGEKK